MNKIEQIKSSYDKWVKILLIGAASIIVSPIIFFAVKGAVGLALAAFVGLIIVNAAPVVSMKIANWKVKAITSEAKENPIETMVTLMQEKQLAYNRFKTSVESAVSACLSFEKKCAAFAKSYPDRASEFNNQLQAMQTLVDRKQTALAEAQQMLATGNNKLEEMRAYYEMAQAANDANSAAGMDIGDMYAKLKVDTACDAVFNSMNKVFATLEVEANLAIANNLSQQANFTNVK
mgnify:FL=1